MKGKKRNAKEVKKVLSEQEKQKVLIPHIVFNGKGYSEEKPFTSVDDLLDTLYETRF